jgi:hypothetical protein
MKLKQFNTVLLLAILVIFLSACQATVGGNKAGERYELKRSITTPSRWEVVLRKDVKSVYEASLEGVKNLGLAVSVSRVDILSGMIRGSFADNKDFEIKISYQSQEITLMGIKIGLTGDKVLSVKLFQAIEGNL